MLRHGDSGNPSHQLIFAAINANYQQHYPQHPEVVVATPGFPSGCKQFLCTILWTSLVNLQEHLMQAPSLLTSSKAFIYWPLLSKLYRKTICQQANRPPQPVYNWPDSRSIHPAR